MEAGSRSDIAVYTMGVLSRKLGFLETSTFRALPNPKAALMTSPTTSPAIHRYRRRIHFSETDAAGVAHFSRLTALVEEAEHDWFMNSGVLPFHAEGGWPRVDLQIQYHAPCTFGDGIEITLHTLTWQHTTLSYHFDATLFPLDAEKPALLFSGKMTICHVRRKPEGGFSPEVIPDALRQALHAESPIKKSS